MSTNEALKRIKEELVTMKIMVYSLKDANDKILRAISSKSKIVDTDEWEEACKDAARRTLKNKKGESDEQMTREKLLKENQKLSKDKLEYAIEYTTMLTSRNKFIRYMNDVIENLETEDVDDEEMKGYLIQRIDTFKEILQKYKEITGVSDENN